MTVMMLLVLHEHIVSDLGVLAAVTAGLTVRTACGLVRHIEHLGVRTAGTILQAPPVILCRKVEYILLLKAGLDPILRTLLISGCILISRKNGSCQMIHVETEHIRQKFKTPLTPFFLEVVTQRPAPHHLKEGHMALVSDRVDIVGSDTPLYVHQSGAERMLLSQQIRHQGLHTGHIKQNARGAVGNQRYRSHIHMSALQIEFFPSISKFIRSELFHCFLSFNQISR